MNKFVCKDDKTEPEQTEALAFIVKIASYKIALSVIMILMTSISSWIRSRRVLLWLERKAKDHSGQEAMEESIKGLYQNVTIPELLKENMKMTGPQIC